MPTEYALMQAKGSRLSLFRRDGLACYSSNPDMLLLSGQNTPGGVGIGMGGWVGPKFQHFGPPGTPPPPRVAGALLGGFGFVQGSEIGLNFSLFFHNMSNILTRCCLCV